jgi:HEAT repeat protein
MRHIESKVVEAIKQIGTPALIALSMIFDEVKSREYRSEAELINEYELCRSAAELLNELNWQPITPVQKAWIWVCKGLWDACESLGNYAVEPLIAAFKHDESNRQAVVAALSKIDDPRVIQPLIDMLQNFKCIPLLRRH